MIPITFNSDDLQNDKKGTVRPADLASMVGLLYPKKVGVLDIYTSAGNPEPVSIKTTSLDTTGYVKITFNRGYVVIYGRLIYVEQDEQVMFPLPTGTESGSIGITVDLGASGANEVKWFMTANTLRTNTNLLDNEANGVYDLALYGYTANSSTFTKGARVVQMIPSIADYLTGANFVTQEASDNSNKLATTAFVNSGITNSKEVQTVDGYISNSTSDTSAHDINSQRGYLPIGKNMLIQWGSVRLPDSLSNNTIRVYFAKTFKELYSLTVTPFNSEGDNFKTQVRTYCTSDFQVKVNDVKTNFCYIAIGTRS